MSPASDPNLISFAAALLEQRGGIVELQEDRIVSLLPQELSESLGLPEELELGSDDSPLLYGSPVLDSLIRLATREVPIMYAKVEVPYLKKEGFEQVIARDVEVVSGRVTLKRKAETMESYLVLTCHYVALSDERKEGLVHVAVHERTGAVVNDMENLWRRFDLKDFATAQIPPQLTACPERAISEALRLARAAAESALDEFVAGMRRRLIRDVRNTREYYEALAKEMEASLSHPSLTETQRTERLSKIADLPRELNLKIEDLKQKYSVKVTVAGKAAVRLLVPVVQLTALVGCGKSQKSLSFIWNSVTRRLDPVVCDRCGSAGRKVRVVAGKPELELVCLSCAEGK